MPSAKHPKPTAQVAKNDPQYRASIDRLKEVNTAIETLRAKHAAPSHRLVEVDKVIADNEKREAELIQKVADAQRDLVLQEKKSWASVAKRRSIVKDREEEYVNKMEELVKQQTSVLNDVQNTERLLGDELLERCRKRQRSRRIGRRVEDHDWEENEDRFDGAPNDDEDLNLDDASMHSSSKTVAKTIKRNERFSEKGGTK